MPRHIAWRRRLHPFSWFLRLSGVDALHSLWRRRFRGEEGAFMIRFGVALAGALLLSACWADDREGTVLV
ncbi:hypothetical protein, partial [Enterobacter hormaechei]|uniref:hypothetical protein n=1 Tax=Enterobacter hormaechei TaxID=158836 RepID=UPI0019543FC4